MFTKLEKQLLNDFFERLEDYMGNAGCNDFDVPNTTEGQELMRNVLNHALQHEEEEKEAQLESLENDIEQGRKNLLTYDFFVLSYLKSKINNMVNGESE